MRGSGLLKRVRQRVVDALASRDALDDQHFRLVLASTLGHDSTFIDVGANQGKMLGEAMRVAPHGRHLAFEPLPRLASELRHVFPQVDVREIALSDREGDASFVHVVNANGYSGLRKRDYPRGVALEEITVRTARLDDELDGLTPALIKIDVEGGELQVLRGAAETLGQAKPVVWFEHGRGAADRYGTAPGEVWDVLGDAGLRVYDADARGPLSRDEFTESFASNRLWNYLAR
jgi:FkbM family methyltransferase